jgi:hypothetical protein
MNLVPPASPVLIEVPEVQAVPLDRGHPHADTMSLEGTVVKWTTYRSLARERKWPHLLSPRLAHTDPGCVGGGPRCHQVAVGPFRATLRHALPCTVVPTTFPSRSVPLCGKRASRLGYLFTVRNASNPFSRSILPPTTSRVVGGFSLAVPSTVTSAVTSSAAAPAFAPTQAAGSIARTPSQCLVTVSRAACSSPRPLGQFGLRRLREAQSPKRPSEPLPQSGLWALVPRHIALIPKGVGSSRAFASD